MRALSIRAPWWVAILRHGKRVENRDWMRAEWQTRGMLGETFLIHASASAPRNGVSFDIDRAGIWARFGHVIEDLHQLPRSAIVGRARLAGAKPNGPTPRDPWAVPGALGLLLADVERLVEPVPVKGALGFFEVDDALLVGAKWEACS